MKPYYQDGRVTMHAGDCLAVLPDLPDASVDAVVTDPPYGLEFMGRDWDKFGRRQNHPLDPSMAISKDSSTDPRAPDNPWQKEASGYGAPRKNPRCKRCKRLRFTQKPCTCAAPDWDTRTDEYAQAYQAWCQQWAAECLRVLKPGGHLLAFGGTRTHHRLTCGIEDAGFEIRDSITWLYGSGFPKSRDVSKAIDAEAGAEREVVGDRLLPDGRAVRDVRGVGNHAGWDRPWKADDTARERNLVVTAPATEAARQWSGWGTALKPASEPIVVARKPLAGTVAANVLAHGTGALNIDACRVPTTTTDLAAMSGRSGARTDGDLFIGKGDGNAWEPPASGRWPPNVALDDSQAAELDAQSGDLTSGAPGGIKGVSVASVSYADIAAGSPVTGYGDTGGASRFFPTFRYEAKADTAERPRHVDTAHPTVKPLDLMRWLVRLVTPPGGLVLDLFAGSGTTAEACQIEGFRCIIIEREAEYLPLIVQRLTKRTDPVRHLADKGADLGLFELLEQETTLPLEVTG